MTRVTKVGRPPRRADSRIFMEIRDSRAEHLANRCVSIDACTRGRPWRRARTCGSTGHRPPNGRPIESSRLREQRSGRQGNPPSGTSPTASARGKSREHGTRGPAPEPRAIADHHRGVRWIQEQPPSGWHLATTVTASHRSTPLREEFPRLSPRRVRRTPLPRPPVRGRITLRQACVAGSDRALTVLHASDHQKTRFTSHHQPDQPTVCSRRLVLRVRITSVQHEVTRDIAAHTAHGVANPAVCFRADFVARFVARPAAHFVANRVHASLSKVNS